MVVPLVEVCHFYTLIETDFGFRYKMPAIFGAIQLVNKHDFDSFMGGNKVFWGCYKLLQKFLMLGAYFLPIF
jgi:hypothetical protein